ncbi:hypothetical protein [Halorubrum depositum]|uniref:hypothetical protein n=1 Tax=Halorubrum depositum TaxID=2583992 RepID=UPI0011AA54E6|nr:hypothetical protein [Halorubrum depositum]
MLSPGNPYVLPSTLVAAGAYLAATLLTDASILVRIGLLVLLAGVVPVVLNRVLGGSPAEAAPEEGVEEPPEA